MDGSTPDSGRLTMRRTVGGLDLKTVITSCKKKSIHSVIYTHTWFSHGSILNMLGINQGDLQHFYD